MTPIVREGLAQRIAERMQPVAESLKEQASERSQEAARRLQKRREELRKRGERAGERMKERGGRAGKRLKERRRRTGRRVKKAALRGGGQVATAKIKRRRRRGRSMLGLLFNRFTFGFGLGYVLGARAGRERYEQMADWWRSFSGNPRVQQMAERGRGMAQDMGRAAAQPLRERARPQSVREVMTPNPRTVNPSTTLDEAARAMRETDAGAMVVVDDTETVVGILTDRDIAIRAVAEGRDAAATTVGELASRDLTTISPTDTVDRAIQLMEERAVRRLPVVEAGRPVGIVSLGDLAIERDPTSTLADISAAPPSE